MKPHLRLAVSPDASLATASGSAASYSSIRRDVTRLSRQARNGAARILLVNADPEALEQLGSRMSSEGREVLAVPTFELAREFFCAISPDLVVADVRLGAFNGLHLAAWIRFEPAPLRSPIIITHSGPEPVLEAEAHRLGADFVVDPLQNPNFLTHVRSALAEYRGPQNTMVRESSMVAQATRLSASR